MSSLIFIKMSSVMRDIGPVTKAQTNTHQRYKFRGIDQFVNALHPALVAHGVVMTTEVLERTENIKEVIRSSGNTGIDKHVSVRVKYTFYAEDGSNVSSTMVGEGLDSGDKATNKALSSALKYALIQTFSVPTEDMAEADLDSPLIGATSKVDSPVTLDVKVVSSTKTGEPTVTVTEVKESGSKPKSTFRKSKLATTEPENGSSKEEDFFS